MIRLRSMAGLVGLLLLTSASPAFSQYEPSAQTSKTPIFMLGGSVDVPEVQGTPRVPGFCTAGGQRNTLTEGQCRRGNGEWTPEIPAVSGSPARKDFSGIFEFTPMVLAALPVLLGITLLWCGWKLSRHIVLAFVRR